MVKIEELQKRVEHLETEVELLKELVKLQNKCPERIIPTYPSTPLQPYYCTEDPTPEPPYLKNKILCKGGGE